MKTFKRNLIPLVSYGKPIFLLRPSASNLRSQNLAFFCCEGELEGAEWRNSKCGSERGSNKTRALTLAVAVLARPPMVLSQYRSAVCASCTIRSLGVLGNFGRRFAAAIRSGGWEPGPHAWGQFSMGVEGRAEARRLELQRDRKRLLRLGGSIHTALGTASHQLARFFDHSGPS